MYITAEKINILHAIKLYTMKSLKAFVIFKRIRFYHISFNNKLYYLYYFNLNSCLNFNINYLIIS